MVTVTLQVPVYNLAVVRLKLMEKLLREECEIFQKIMLPCAIKSTEPLASNLFLGFLISEADLLLSELMKLKC